MMTTTDFDSENYAAIRSEYTEIFSSFRNLVLAQLAAIALVAEKLLSNNTNVNSILALSFTFALVVIFSTIMGHNWFSQAVYQTSYLFVAYELPLYRQTCQGKHSEQKHLWILANRAKSRVTHHRSNWFDKYYAGQELRLFHGLQLILAGIIWATATLLLYVYFSAHHIQIRFILSISRLSILLLIILSSFSTLSFLSAKVLVKNESRRLLRLLIVCLFVQVALACYLALPMIAFDVPPQVDQPPTGLILFVEIFLFLTILITYWFDKQATTLIERATRHWIKYMVDRKNLDAGYVNELAKTPDELKTLKKQPAPVHPIPDKEVTLKEYWALFDT